MTRQIQELLFGRFPWNLRECHFRFRHPLPCRGFALYFRSGVFAGQFLVGQSLTECRASGLDEACRVRALALIVAESLLIQIAEQMKRLDAHVGPLQTTLQERPEILDPVRM